MTIKEALYDNFRRLLTNLSTDSEVIEGYSKDLGSQEKESSLTDLGERIEKELIKELDNTIESKNLLIIDDSHLELINDYKASFPEYPRARFEEISLILCLIRTLNSVLLEDLNFDEELENPKYRLIDFGIDKFGTDVFHYFDPNASNNDIVLFNFANLAEILTYFSDPAIAITPQLLIHLISKIGQEDNPLQPLFYTLIYHETSFNKYKSKSYIALHLITNGKICHEPYKYTKRMSMNSIRNISVVNNYHQFRDTLTILSEYNSQDDILDKFLRLYHVIENFMFKSPLVNLERKQNGKPFSFRDFQRIHNKINKSEIETLKKLIQKVFEVDQHGNTKFKTYTFNLLVNIVRRRGLISELNLNNLFSYLGLERNTGVDLIFANISLDTIHKYYAEILYSLRNSLVHNKESEFHLTHETLLRHYEIQDTLKVLLEEFLMPTMEEIIVYLLTDNDNDIVWFSNSKLTLWET